MAEAHRMATMLALWGEMPGGCHEPCAGSGSRGGLLDDTARLICSYETAAGMDFAAHRNKDRGA